jgi:Mg/Co/Ni transporter MgtE
MSDRDELLANMSHEEAREVPDLQPHRRHRHSLMNTEFVALSEKLSVASI